MRTVNTNGMLRVGDSRDYMVTQWEIEKETLMVLKAVYRQVHEYLREEGWSHPQAGNHQWEDLYWERWEPNGDKSQWAWWRLSKDLNRFVRYFIAMDWQTLYVKPRDLVYKGQKRFVGHPEFVDLKIYAKFYLQFDIEDLFLNSIAWKFKKAFFNRMYRQEMEQHKEELYYWGLKIQSFIKTILEMPADREWSSSSYGKFGFKDWGEEWETEVG